MTDATIETSLSLIRIFKNFPSDIGSQKERWRKMKNEERARERETKRFNGENMKWSTLIIELLGLEWH